MVPRAVEDEVRDFTIDRIPQAIKLSQTAQRVINLKQWSIWIVTCPIVQLNHWNVQIDNPTVAFQHRSIRRIHHCSATSRDHLPPVNANARNGRRLPSAKPGLTLKVEDRRNRNTSPTNDLVVDV